MRTGVAPLALISALTVAASSEAMPLVDVRGAAVRIVIIPEQRQGVRVVILKRVRELPLRITRSGQNLSISGNLGHTSRGCFIAGGKPGVRIKGRADVAYENLPEIFIFTPRAMRIAAGEAVFGTVGRSDSLDLANRGCGAWTVANVGGHLRVNQSGSGHIAVGTAGVSDLSVAGAGQIVTRNLSGALTAVSSNSGNISVGAVAGALNLHVAGPGDIRVSGGSANQMTASVAGSGVIHFGGTAGRLNAMVAGSGLLSVRRVNGPAKQQVFGSGSIRVGH